jgi:hypothetical protein
VRSKILINLKIKEDFDLIAFCRILLIPGDPSVSALLRLQDDRQPGTFRESGEPHINPAHI